MKTAAVQHSKICNDLALALVRPALRTLRTPTISAAARPVPPSCPGKVNPVIPEVVSQVCFQIIGAAAHSCTSVDCLT
jgi:aspartate ammonia-lyase